MKKEYDIQIGEVFTEKKAQELIAYLRAKDEEIRKLTIVCSCEEPWTLGVIHSRNKPCYWPS